MVRLKPINYPMSPRHKTATWNAKDAWRDVSTWHTCKGLVCVQGSCLELLVFGGWWTRIQDNSDEAEERWRWHRWGKLQWGGGCHITCPPALTNREHPRRTATRDLWARWGQRLMGASRDASSLDLININLKGKCQKFLIQSMTCNSEEQSSVLASVNVIISIVMATAAQMLNNAESPASDWQRNRRGGGSMAVHGRVSYLWVVTVVMEIIGVGSFWAPVARLLEHFLGFGRYPRLALRHSTLRRSGPRTQFIDQLCKMKTFCFAAN